MRPRSGGLGCLGCFSILVMLGVTAAQVGVLFWLNPAWFDRAAFWRGPLLLAEESLAIDSRARSEFGRREAEAAARKKKSDGVVLMPALAVEASYTPDQGARVDMPEGSRLDFPPGSVRGAQKLKITPVARTSREMKSGGAVMIGPLFDINVGGQEHYAFDRPARMTVPYDPALLPDPKTTQGLTIATWENGTWAPLPSTIDAVNHTVTAELRHASIDGLIIIAATLVAAGMAAGSEPLEAIRKQLQKRTDGLYETPNFSVRYFKTWNPGRPLDDAAYPLAAGRKTGEHPLYIQDVGRLLEEIRAGLDKVGTPVAAVKLYRWDAFVVPMSGDYGASPAGGPLLITTDFSNADGSLGDLDGLMRSTIAHELIHVGQGSFFRYYSAATAATESWWIESTANFLSDRYWRLQGRQADSVQFYLDGKGDLLTKPFDLARGTETYAYGRFLEWIEKRGDVQGVINKMNQGGTVSLKALDAAVRAVFPGQTLGDLFVEFSKDFYHGSLWSGDVFPVKGGWDGADPARTAGRYDHLTRVDGGGLSAVNVFGASRVELPHLSATGIHYHADRMPPDRWAKLVIAVESATQPAARTWVLGGESAIPGRPPVAGAPTPLMPLIFEKSKDGPWRATYVIKRLATPPDPAAGKANHATLVLVNTDLVQDAEPLAVRRWILLPPEFVSSKRQADKSYRADWAEAEAAGRNVWFKGYNVYRRRKGDSEWPKAPVNAKPIPDAFHVDSPPDSEDYVYTATVVDKFDNESAPAKVEDEDPFQGEWNGKFVLVEGELRKPILDALQKLKKEMEEKERADIAKLKPPDRDRALRNLAENLKKADEGMKFVDEYLGKVEQAARLGIPVTMKIRLSEGAYFMKLSKLGFFPVEQEAPEIAMKRTSLTSIAPKEKPPETLPPLDLKLIRREPRSQINQVYEVETPEFDGKRFKYGIRIQLERDEK